MNWAYFWFGLAGLVLFAFLLSYLVPALVAWSNRATLLRWAGLSKKDCKIIRKNKDPLSGFFFSGVQKRREELVSEIRSFEKELQEHFSSPSGLAGFEYACERFIKSHLAGSDTQLSHQQMAGFKTLAFGLGLRLDTQDKLELGKRLVGWSKAVEQWEGVSCKFFAGELGT